MLCITVWTKPLRSVTPLNQKERFPLSNYGGYYLRSLNNKSFGIPNTSELSIYYLILLGLRDLKRNETNLLYRCNEWYKF